MCRSARFTFTALLLPGAIAHGAEVLSTRDLPPTRLRFGSVSFYSENDKYFAGTDQHYTNGFKLSFLSTDLLSFTDDPVPKPVQQLARTLGRLVPPGRDYKLGLALGQNLYTPVDTTATAPILDDRPYAAWLYGSASFQIYTPPRVFASGLRAIGRLDTIEVSLGLVGPGALGRQTQNGVHDLIGVAKANGWRNQIHNEPGLLIAYERKYRVGTRDARDGFGADVIPHFGLSLGNISSFVNAGGEIRVGWRLPADFGTNLIRPSGDSNARSRPDFSWFGFAAFDLRAVAQDITLRGNTFEDSPRIGLRAFVADLLGGIAIGTRRYQFTYAQAVRSIEFNGQPQSSVFGSFSVTFFY
jgi:lipid A 3-O-deacylase